MKSKKICYQLIMTFSMILCFYLCIRGISYNSMIGILPDELGYWSGVAFINNFDWTGATRGFSYYGFGYSFILNFLYKLMKNSFLAYQAAIVLNGILISSQIPMIKNCVKKFDQNIDDFSALFIAIGLNFYSFNLVLAKTTLVESLISWITWLVFWRLIENRNIFDEVLTLVLAFYAFAVHQRMIALIISVVVYWLLVNYQRDKSLKKIFMILILSIIFFLCINFTKGQVIKNVYSSTSTKLLSYTNFGGQINKVKQILSVEGLLLLIISLLSKLFYAISATWGIVVLGILYLLKKIKFYLLNKEYPKLNIYVFAILLFFCSEIISAIYMKSNGNRFDMLLYGRYSEYAVQLCMLYNVPIRVDTFKT